MKQKRWRWPWGAIIPRPGHQPWASGRIDHGVIGGHLDPGRGLDVGLRRVTSSAKRKAHGCRVRRGASTSRLGALLGRSVGEIFSSRQGEDPALELSDAPFPPAALQRPARNRRDVGRADEFGPSTRPGEALTDGQLQSVTRDSGTGCTSCLHPKYW